jgi:hypothetical protein
VQSLVVALAYLNRRSGDEPPSEPVANCLIDVGQLMKLSLRINRFPSSSLETSVHEIFNDVGVRSLTQIVTGGVGPPGGKSGGM